MFRRLESKFETVEETIDLLKYIAEDVSLRFGQWDNQYARGPSLYFIVISAARFDSFVDPLGTNRWPVESARTLPDDAISAAQVGAKIAFDRDGAVVVAADGTFQRQMVRVRSLSTEAVNELEYPGWMSAKHMSALEASIRDGVLAAVTLSEENGRVTVFKNGSYEDRKHEELGGHWRVDRPTTAIDPDLWQDDADVGPETEGNEVDTVTGQRVDGSLITEHAKTDQLVDRLVDVAESLSTGFDRWEEQYVSGPSLYFVVVADANYEEYADPLGANTWPIDTCQVATNDIGPLVTATREVAFSCDGAIVIMTDGTVQEQMVRIRSPSATEVERRDAFDYAGWMGTKHLSAVEISNREEVLAAVTLSEEDGRVTVFRNGSYQDRQREELGGRWRGDG